MKRRENAKKRHSWMIAWLLQCACMLGACLLISATRGLNSWMYGVALWVCAPLFGGLTAWRAVLSGLNNYLAWIAPPACLYAAHYALWQYAPSAGAALVCALISLIGAAAGEVTRERR